MFKNKYGRFRSAWYILATTLIVLAGQLIFSLPGSTFVSIAHLSDRLTNAELNELILTKPFYFLLIQGGGAFGGIAATLVAFRALNKKQPNQIGLTGRIKDLFFGLFLGMFTMAIIFSLLYFTGQIKIISSLNMSGFLLIYLFVFILVGIFEEVFFRGYMMRTMAMNHNKPLVMYLSSALIFSLFHVFNPHVSFFGLINIIFVGILFAYMFDRTNSLLLPIGFHITWNFFQGAIFGFPVSGIPPKGLIEIDLSHSQNWLTGGSFGAEGSVIATIVIALSFIATYLYTKNNERDKLHLVQ